MPEAKWWELELLPKRCENVKTPVSSTVLLPFKKELKETQGHTALGACANEGNSEAQSDRENKNLAEIMLSSKSSCRYKKQCFVVQLLAVK